MRWGSQVDLPGFFGNGNRAAGARPSRSQRVCRGRDVRNNLVTLVVSMPLRAETARAPGSENVDEFVGVEEGAAEGWEAVGGDEFARAAEFGGVGGAAEGELEGALDLRLGG